MSAEPLTREERERLMSDLGWRDGPWLVDRYESTVQAAEAERDALARRVERAEKVVGLFRALDDDAGPGEASYAQAWDMVADLIAALAADDAARGEA